MGRRVFPLAAILCALAFPVLAAEAQQGAADAGPPAPKTQSTGADAGARDQNPPLSAEDANVVKQLALLEDVELLRNLDLFDDTPAEAARSPDAGTPDGGPAPAPQADPKR